MPKRVPFLLLLLSLAAVAHAAGPSVTVYSRDLGFVRESRALAGRTGRDTVRLENVSNRLDFSSVRLAPATGRVTRLAYRWDTASGDAFVEKAIGERVRVVSRGNRVAEGVLVSADASWLVLRGDDGTVSTQSREAVEEVRLSQARASLSLRPAIEAILEGAKAPTTGELSYLTKKVNFSGGTQGLNDVESKNTYIQIPILLRINTGSRSNNGPCLFFLVGPAFDIKVSSNEDFTDLFTDPDDVYEGIEYGLMAGAGFEAARIGVQFRYTWGLNNILATDAALEKGFGDTKFNSFQIVGIFRIN